MSTLTQTLEQIERQKALWDAAQPLPASLLEQLREDWEVTQTYNSNAIEGNTLTLAETKVILLHGVTVGGKQINEHLEAVSHRDAMHLMMYAAQMKRPLEEMLVLELHRILFNRIDDDDAGRYRSTRTSVTGSGRTFPMLMNLILLHHEYPPVFVPVEQRVAYVHALWAIEERNVTVLDELIAQITLQSLETMVAVVA